MPLAHTWDLSSIASFKAVLGEQLDYYETATRLGKEFGDDPREPEWSLARSLLYHLTPRPDLSDPGSRIYAPMIELADGRSQPETVGAAAEATLTAWADAYEIFGDFPLVVARVADLLWLRRHGSSPHQYAQAAQKALRALWHYPGMPDVSRADCLVRALDVVSEANIKHEAAATINELVAAARASLHGPQRSPGVFMRLIPRLAALPTRQRPAELNDLIRSAADEYREETFILDAVLQLRLQLAGSDPAQRRAAATEIVHMWEQAADDTVPLVAFRHIEQALAVARTEGLSGEIERLRVRLQELSRQDQGFTEFSIGIDIPAAEVEGFIAKFLAGDRPQAWLRRFGSYCPVHQDRELVASQVRELMQQAPFQFLVSKIQFNDQGLPIKLIAGHEEHFRQALIDQDSGSITVWSVFAAEILDRMMADPQMTTQLIAEFLAQGVFDAALAEGVARAFEHYAAGRYEEALLCCVHRLEAALRAASMDLGLVVYTEPVAATNRLGSFKALGDLLRGLIGRTPENERSYLHLLLADPLSLNLRNRALHGLMQDISKRDAALVLHAASLLALWQRTIVNAPLSGTEPRA